MEIVIASSNQQPFPVEMVVFEEDTHRIMSAGNRIDKVPESTEASLEEMTAFIPHEIGELVVKGNRCFAIVHDFACDPSFDPEGARSALEKLSEVAANAGLESLAIHAFGQSLDPDNAMLRSWIEDTLGSGPVKRVWLVVD